MVAGAGCTDVETYKNEHIFSKFSMFSSNFTVISCYKVLMSTIKNTHARNIPGISSIVNKMVPSC